MQTEPTIKKTRAEKKTKQVGNGGGTVWKLPSGRWRWQVTLGFTLEGKRQAKSGTETNKTLADAALARAKADYSRGLLGVSEDITLAAYSEKWLKRQKGLRASSIRNYKKEIAYAMKHLGKMKLKAIKPHHVKDCLTTLSETVMEGGKRQPMSNRTLGKVRTRLKAIFKEAVSDGLLYVNPMEAVKRVKGHEGESGGIALDEVQMTRLHELGLALWEAGVCRLFPAIFAAASLGLRRGEVMGLRWEDVDFEKNLLRIRKGLTASDGQPNLGEVKTRKSRRDVPIPLSLKNILLAHMDRQRLERERAETAWTETGAVFATTTGEFTHPDNLNRAITNLCEWSDPKLSGERRFIVIPLQSRAKLKTVITAGKRLPDLKPHDLRHTAATLMLKRRTPVEVVSRILGHARVSITLDIYRHVLDAETEQTMPDLFDVPLPMREIQAVVLN
jgi:integrase